MKDKIGRGGNAVRNVCDLMDHAIREGKRLFRNTPFRNKWMMYYDAFSSWRSKGAQEYLRLTYPRFANRQVRGLAFTNAGTRYEYGLPGDTPEYMPLDSNLFSDLETAVRWNVAATLALDAEDPRKFTLCTPGNVWGCDY